MPYDAKDVTIIGMARFLVEIRAGNAGVDTKTKGWCELTSC